MKFSENWLREWVDPGVSRDELCTRLDMIGLEVESVATLGEALDGVVVAQIVEATPHPDADRLQVCQVDIGAGTPLQIVCGAPNARVGLKAPLATVGTRVGDITIKAAKLRGVESSGMLCSAKELGLDQDASGLLELSADAPVGQPLADFLGLPDAVIELGLTPNRADCLGMRGIAHDIAAVYDRDVSEPPFTAIPAAIDTVRAISLQAGDACPRYLGRVVEGIDARASTPLWLAERLRRAGIRPISAVVDITAYVMLELGQPMHAFDNDRLSGGVVVRQGQAGEQVELLDARTVEIDNGFLVIADDSGAIALAGVMGGLGSRVTDDTHNVFLESAHFAPSAIIGRARRLGMHTDASHRFERGVDPELPRRAIERATELLLAIAGGRPGPVIETSTIEGEYTRPAVTLRRARIGRLLGIEIADARVERILSRLGMTVTNTPDGWLATPPSWRFDIAIEEDLIEEVARIYGYDEVPTRAPAGDLAPTLPSEERLADDLLRRTLAARQWQEALTFAFLDKSLLATWGLDQDTVDLANPLSAELGTMRTSLLPGLVQVLAYNRARQNERLRLFELGRSFRARSGQSPDERDQLAMALSGPVADEGWGAPRRLADFHDLKGDLEALIGLGGEGARWRFEPVADIPWLHPGQAARIFRDDEMVGQCGSLHPALLKALGLDDNVLVAELALDALRSARVPSAQPLSRFPSVRRDIAIVVAETVAWADVEQAVRAAVGEDLEHLLVFDEYRGPGLSNGVKSLAIGLILRNPSRTLTDKEADAAVTGTLAALKLRFNAELRT